MTEPHKKAPQKVTLERLIQLKRSERPAPTFWDDFERDLHRRQLAALVTVEPWRNRVGRVLVTMARRLAPAGAGAAAIALVVLALHRMDQVPLPPTAESLAIEAESRAVLLPEEQISVSTMQAPRVRSEAGLSGFTGHVRSAPHEIASGLAVARRFITVAAPVTFSSENDASASYSANALTAGTVFRSFVATAPESL